MYTHLLCLQAEELGCEGKVEEAQGIMKLCDQLNEERSQLQNVSIKDVSTMLTVLVSFLHVSATAVDWLICVKKIVKRTTTLSD